MPQDQTLLDSIGAELPVSYINVNGSRLAVKRWGAGPAVLCLHAIGHGSGDFQALADRIADRFEVVAIDWPGQGRSPDCEVPPFAREYSDLVIAACDALELARPILIGNSIGGAAAIEAAARSPERFKAIVICNPGGLSELDALSRFVLARMVSFFRAGASGARWFPFAFRAYYASVLSRKPAHVQRELIVRAGRLIAPLLAEAWRGFGEPAADIRAKASGLRIPVFAAWAKSDRFVSWSRSKKAVSKIPDHRVRLFDGGHAAFLEDPDVFAEALLDFVKEIGD